ncbi:MAG TPA: bifunctional diaminohydroxyphosphoribosylaminopyrimidine deaminase/5-amino-6-(5-phosphoribosylamino)uracil reductase RibD [Bacilli bacterium]|nr:bifunctional diaminohydroxyphosphoribosylaminopyrimidine deaminase/5-amino-6-(5-phosphoribosylamino)uracil reductase RibD [Bacilli bacterium]
MKTIISKRMKTAIKFGQKLARKGEGRPFLVMYFFAKDNNAHDRGFFLNEKQIVDDCFSTLLPITYDLYLPYELDGNSNLDAALKHVAISKVYIGVDNVNNNGVANIFSSRNVEIIRGIEGEAAKRFNEVYLYNEQTNKPFIALSFGMSIDGKIATKTGDSRYISGPQARALVHKLRDRYQAILVGINTVRVDHPRLTARLRGRVALDPIRVVLDSRLSIALDEPILHLDSKAKTIIVALKNVDLAKKQALLDLGAIVLEVEEEQGHVSLVDTIAKLYELGIDSIFVEGGATIHFAFISQNLFNIIYAYISPIIIGGITSPSAVGGEGFAYLKDATNVEFSATKRLGRDIVMTMRPLKKGSNK